MSSTLLGIDIGTTGVRAVIFTREGTLVAEASVPCAHASPLAGHAEIDADDWWNAVVRALRELGTRADVASVAGIGIVGQAPTAVTVDETGRPTRRAILWLDTRATSEARELGSQAYYLGPKLLWLARHDPDALSRAQWVLQSHAFVAYRMTGEVATDPSTAALASPLFDLERRDWLHDACDRFGLRAAQLPPIRRSEERLGAVTREASMATGLPEGIPVAVGGGDFAAATLGAGVLDEGEACLMLGTAGNLLVPSTKPGTDPRLIHAHHVGIDRWLSLGGTLSGGAQEWFRRSLTDAVDMRAPLPSFEELDGEASRVPPGSDGLLFLPYLQGERTPIWNPHARGAFVGLGLEHGRGHMWRAVLEGIALGFLDCQDVVRENGVEVQRIIAANGGGKSSFFRQILSDVLGASLLYTPKGGGTAAGAAILGGMAAGIVRDVGEARDWRGAMIRHEPVVANTRRYRALASIRRDVYAGLEPAFSALAHTRA